MPSTILLFAADAAGHGPTLWPIGLPIILGAAAIYLLLPRPRPFPRLWGALAAALAILSAAGFWIRAGGIRPDTILFYGFSGVAVITGGVLVTHRNPVRAALSFALVVLSTCGLFLLLAAPFLMAATIIIYAGAIIVTFLFVIMLAQQTGISDADLRSREPLLASITGFVLLGALLFVLRDSYGSEVPDKSLSQAKSVGILQPPADLPVSRFSMLAEAQPNRPARRKAMSPVWAEVSLPITCSQSNLAGLCC
jgi:NADH:ubiquinone oxidoreductase subunit 6 (subunit J)